jgi:hypothetical protein
VNGNFTDFQVQGNADDMFKEVVSRTGKGQKVSIEKVKLKHGDNIVSAPGVTIEIK